LNNFSKILSIAIFNTFIIFSLKFVLNVPEISVMIKIGGNYEI